jgi:hypothetical protein
MLGHQNAIKQIKQIRTGLRAGVDSEVKDGVTSDQRGSRKKHGS